MTVPDRISDLTYRINAETMTIPAHSMNESSEHALFVDDSNKLNCFGRWLPTMTKPCAS